MVADPGDQSVTILSDHRRRLIAVVYADMAGYSRLIGLDDASTFERLREMRRDLIDPAIARHGGTLVSTGGDSLLVSFDNIISAMRFAVELQRGVPDFDGDFAPDRRMRFRVGVTVGDVIPDGGNLHGDGVNVAARLQAICPPGAICVSRVVRDQVGNRLGLGFKGLGEIELKNIARPTEAFLLELAPPAEKYLQTWMPRRSVGMLAAALICIAVIFGGLEVAGVSLRSKLLPTGIGGLQVAAPRLSIAVLPFSSPSGDPDLVRLADGTTEDLTTDLTQLSDALVSTQRSLLRFKDGPVVVQKVGEELNVRYLLAGSLRRISTGVRANVALISCETGATLWTDQLDVSLQEGATEQEELAGWLRNSVRRELIWVEAARSVRERADHPDAVDLDLQAQAILQEQPSMKRAIEAQSLYQRALSLDPTSLQTMVGLASAILVRYASLGGDFDPADFDHAEELTAAAEAIAPTNRRVLWLWAELLRVQQRWPEAETAFERLLSLYPHFDSAVQLLGICKLQLGHAEDAIPLFQRVIRDDPRSPGIWVPYLRMGQALLYTGRYDEAVRWFQRGLAADPELPAGSEAFSHAAMASAYALGGHTEQARTEIGVANALWPYLTVRGFLATTVANETFLAQIERVREGLRLAGLRDHADEQEDFGVVPDSRLRTYGSGKTPLTVPGATTIRTTELAALVQAGMPIVLDGSFGNYSLRGAIILPRASLGGSLQDFAQDRLRRLMVTLTARDLSRPIVTLGVNAERWTGYNLALRLVALGYRQVFWYRGGREAWEAAGLPIDRARVAVLSTK